MGYAGVNHLAMITDDMDKTVRFYRDVLGMRVVATLGGQVRGRRMRHYFFSIGPKSCLAFC
jgi:catechol 2,3-dioxygenase-like lactoylglutathione lyase family enzyme